MKLTNYPEIFKASKGWVIKFLERFNINIKNIGQLKMDYKNNPKIHRNKNNKYSYDIKVQAI